MLIEKYLEVVVKQRGSDLHISAGLPPVVRIDGNLQRMDVPALKPEEVELLLFPMLNKEQRRKLEQDWELDFSYGIQGLSRFRVNIYKDRGNYAAAFRVIASKVPSFKELGLSDTVRKIAEKPRGLVLVTGPTGSGKSTTLAAMINYINETRSEHILTIEDPIEFIHPSKRSIIHQRELGQDTRSFANALKSALREDPDIILVGEMRDHETIQTAMTAAETGHLILSSLHTIGAANTISRIIDVFEPSQQHQIAMQLSMVLRAVVSQQLVPAIDGHMVPAFELMIMTPAISNMIRDNKTHQIDGIIYTSAKDEMRSMDSSLLQLYHSGTITAETALRYSTNPDMLRKKL